MKSEVKAFLESSLLEEYLLGLTNPEQTREVERYIGQYPSVREEFEGLQQSIESFAQTVAIDPPAGLKSNILQQIARQSEIPARTSEGTGLLRRIKRLSVAAGIAALVCAGLAAYLWVQNQHLEQSVADLTTEVTDLRGELDQQQVQYVSLEEQFSVIDDPATGKFVLRGNTQSPGFAAVAYWNDTREQSYLNVVSLPTLPNEQCYQLWVDVEGEMISLGVIPDEDGLVALPFMTDAESLNVTIEPKGGSEHPTVSRLVANVLI